MYSRTRRQDQIQMTGPGPGPGTRPDQMTEPDSQTVRPSGQTTGYRPDRVQIQQASTAVCIAKARILYKNY